MRHRRLVWFFSPYLLFEGSALIGIYDQDIFAKIFFSGSDLFTAIIQSRVGHGGLAPRDVNQMSVELAFRTIAVVFNARDRRRNLAEVAQENLAALSFLPDSIPLVQ